MRVCVDTTCFLIKAPLNDQELFYYAQHHRHHIKYEIAINFATSEIIWICPGEGIGGCVIDLKVAEKHFLHQLQPGEGVFGDRIYKGYPGVLLVPIEGKPETLTPAEQMWNMLHSYCCFQVIKQVNHFFKQ